MKQNFKRFTQLQNVLRRQHIFTRFLAAWQFPVKNICCRKFSLEVLQYLIGCHTSRSLFWTKN
jgi:hypothetical protein